MHCNKLHLFRMGMVTWDGPCQKPKIESIVITHKRLRCFKFTFFVFLKDTREFWINTQIGIYGRFHFAKRWHVNTGFVRHEDDDHCKDPDYGSRGEVNCATVTRAGLSSHRQDQHSSNPCNNILNVGPLPTCVTCVNMDKCVTGARSILLTQYGLSIIWWRRGTYSAFSTVLEPGCSECEAGVRGNCPLHWLATWAPHATDDGSPGSDLQHGQPWLAGPEQPVTTAALSQPSVVSGSPRRQHLPCTGWHWAWTRSADRIISVHSIL